MRPPGDIWVLKRNVPARPPRAPACAVTSYFKTRGSSLGTWRTVTAFSRGSNARMVSRIARCSVWIAPGNECTRSLKSGMPNSGHDGDDPRRAFSSTRRCSMMESCSSSARVARRPEASSRDSNPRPGISQPRTPIAWDPDGLCPAGPIAGGHGDPLRVPSLIDSSILRPAVLVLDAAVDPRPLDGVEREGDLLERVL